MYLTQQSPETVLTEMLQELPETEHGNLVPNSEMVEVPASASVDPEWMTEQLRLSALRWGIEDRFVLGTLWWYSASNWLVLPTIASSFLTGTTLSPALDDVVLHWRSEGRISGARSTRVLTGPVAPALNEALGATIEHVASICGKGERRLWSFVVDAIANRYLRIGTATDRVDEAMEAARDLIGQMSSRLPQPRFHTVTSETSGSSQTFVRRGSCCLLYQVPDKNTCATCPRQHPDARSERLRERVS